MAGDLYVKKHPVTDLQPMVQKTLMMKGVRPGTKARVIWVIDVSPSMSDEYASGLVTNLAARVLPIGLTLDDDGKIPVYALNDGVYRMQEPLTLANYEGYVNKYLRQLISGGTNYSPTMEAVLQDTKPGTVAFVLFMTDGNNRDHERTTDMMYYAAHLPIFWQFVGLDSDQSVTFDYLQRLDDLKKRRVDNADLSVVRIRDVDDQRLYNDLLKEFGSYPQKAQEAGILPWQPHMDWAWAQQQPKTVGGGGLGSKLGGLLGKW